MGICTKLPTISSCCCGCTLQTGTLILGWFYLILTVLSLSSFGTIMSQLDKNDKVLGLYFFMVVNSFYQQLKGGARSRTPAI
uniref:CSON012344 protein n=1 Tax=Culicoides sonorensis TaxID=179676 RepID=A0A336KPZ0_CULSO